MTTTSTSPDAAGIWRAVRAPVVIVVVLLLTALITVLIGAGAGGALDPRSAEEPGSRAVARLLEAEGVGVELVGTAEQARARLDGDATLLITHPNRIRVDELRGLRETAAGLVLLAPAADTLAGVTDALAVSGTAGAEARAPGCAFPAATAAGPLTLGGTVYRAMGGGGEADVCYRRDEAGSLARVADRDGELTVLGDTAPLTNARLAEEGNAALALNLLGQRPTVVWYLPSAGDTALRAGETSIYDLIPDAWTFGAVQVGVAVLLLALWRARRLGPVVTEPLPVVVRAAETVEGRSRLYRRAGAAEHAAQALRKATRDRVLPTIGLSVAEAADPGAVTEAVAARTGRATGEVRALLYSSAVTGDAELVRLASELDALERDCAT
ncbi:hypothetical protein SAMN05216266_11557 [Amycolatopsis marina]|uniref:DUF4350 domain-containing protein n=1 Tax=Amycolatopsis marina TaxID=490629 RepID=A0A1I1BLM8_9PSEU|nr:DUF4350 domain-containing protein [Amycolatopsis marina]SFB51255.1 hypothetical protein SAMN05216266_11557 [Amycolatopsis marina]